MQENDNLPPRTMWDTKYGEESYFYGTQPNDFLKENVGKIPKGRVLCLADGEGRNSVFLAQQGYDVTAVDSSAVGMRKASALAKSKGVSVTTIVADLNDFDLGEGMWSGIVSIFCHLPSTLRGKVHGSIAPALSPKGVFLMECYSPDQLEFGTGGPKNRDLLVTALQAEQELAGLLFSHLKQCTRTIVEGQGHNGQSAVTQVIAAKE